MDLIVPILTVAVAALYARSEARKDAATIAADMEVNHVQGFLARAFLGILFALIMSCGAWCLWTTVFRLRLNAAMGWHRYYLGSTSRYDLFMISLVLFAKNWRWPNVVGLRATHQGAYQFAG